MADPDQADQTIKFVPFRSDLELGFYTNVFQTKLEDAKLDDSARPIIGLYTPGTGEPALSARMLVNSNALTAQQ
jgi:ubiquitin-like modifier-activating enzyme ATG7